MATAVGFLQSPLVVWANNTFKASALIESITDLADGVFLNEIMMDIDPTYFTLTRIHQNVYGDVNLRMQNLDTLVKHLKRYYQDKLQQLVLLRIPDVVTIAREPQSDEAAEELNKILLLMLGCAVQCDNKEHFIERIKEMDLEVQKSLVEYIQQITDNTDNVLTFRAHDLSEYPADQLLLYAENMFYHITQLSEDRDNCVGMVSHLSYERDALLRDSESKNRGAFSPPPSPAVRHNKELPSTHANKEKIRLLTEEIEEKNVALSELRDELIASKKSLETLRQENKSLSQDARWVKAYRDEIDALKSKTDKVDRLEADNHRFKEKLRDLDYYKKRAEELKEQNELLYETRVVLEEQLTGLNSKEERIEILEEENKKLKSHIHHLAEERQFDQLKLKEVMEENAQLIVDKQNSMAEAASLTSELDALRGKKSPGSTTFASEYSESSSIEVLRMQRENQQLRKTIDELKHSGQRIIELRAENEQLQNATLDGKTTVFNLNEELARLKARGLQQENDLNKLRSIAKRQQEELKTSVDNVLNLSGELREKDVEMSQVEEQSLLNFQLSEEKVQDLVSMADELKEKEAKITQLNQEAEQKQEKITELSRLAEERESNVMELYERVKENELEITKLAEQSENKNERITELTKLTQLKEEKLADLNLELRERKKEISELQDLLKEKEDVVAKISQKIKVREETIAELKESIEAKIEGCRAWRKGKSVPCGLRKRFKDAWKMRWPSG
ncbi:positive regulation of protein localization to cilium [Desmophyllum pertusum]|uniref:Positive regulation of protein localization to cilium n=1 Tax=Desmophyllum pertusum TaxID=174260 RepID=A0A9W9ZL28_9CNID|nr:positive regulation of protein localization to cilium [Desmophyllum pertusum]